MATLIKADGTETEVKPSKGSSFKLEELQKHVGGYIEPVRLVDGKTMLVDEDGRSKQLPYNEGASKRAGQTIVGNALIVNGREFR